MADASWPEHAARNAEVTDHAENPAKPCEILLDGEVIVEGRWSQLFGFIELD